MKEKNEKLQGLSQMRYLLTVILLPIQFADLLDQTATMLDEMGLQFLDLGLPLHEACRGVCTYPGSILYPSL